MSSTYGWLTESALAIERPVPLRGVSQQSQILLASVVRKQQERQQKQLSEQQPLFAHAAKSGKVFTHDEAECARRWTRPTTKPLDWAGRQFAGRNDGIGLRSARDESERNCRAQNFLSVESHLEKKAKLYDRIVRGVFQNTPASLLLHLRQKRRNVQKSQHMATVHDQAQDLTSPQLSIEALAELVDLPDGSGMPVNETQIAQQQATRLAFLQARLNLYRHVLSGEPHACS